MCDFVYVFKESGDDGFSLRYSLRSLINSDCRRVYLIGDCPNWLKNVVHVPHVSIVGHKLADVICKLRLFCERKESPKEFTFSNDDFFILEKVAHIENFHKGFFEVKRNYYRKAYSNTLEALQVNGIENPLDAEVHCPIVFNRNELQDVLRATDGELILFRSLYFNLFSRKRSPRFIGQDFKVRNGQGLQEAFQRPFLSVDDATADLPEFRTLIQEKFPTPSVYEK
jgi:hypothetical protein